MATPTEDLQQVLDAIRTGRLETAAGLLAEATDLSPTHLNYAWGLYYKATGQLDLARQQLSAAREAAVAASDQLTEANILVALAHTQHLLLNSREALTLLQEAVQLRERQGDVGGQIAALCNIAGIHRSLNDNYSAMVAVSGAQTLFETMEPAAHPTVELGLLNTLSNILSAQNRTEEAAQQYRRCLEVAQLVGDTTAYFIAAINLGDAYLKLGHYQDGQTLLQEVLAHPDLHQIPVLQASVILNLALTKFHLDGLDALADAQQAHTTFEQLQDPDGLIESGLLLARLHQRSGQLGQSRTAAEQALALAEADGRKQSQLDALTILADVTEAADPAQAARHLRRVLVLQTELNAAAQDKQLQELTAQAEVDSAQRRAAYEQTLRLQAEETVQRQLQELERGRLYDPLTGLPNRLMLHAQLAQHIEQAQRQGTEFLLVSADLNRFQLVNDTYGHDAADELLRVVAGRLRAALRGDEVVARVGGDEFTLLLGGGGHGSRRLQDAIDALNQPVVVGGQSLRMSWSVGAACWPADARDPEALRQASELALYDAKTSGESCVYYDRRQHAHAGLERALAHALERSEFELHFQPMLDVRTRRVVCAEALLRWRSAEHGLLFPGSFMPILERSGQIVEVGAWVLQEACRHAACWKGVRVAVNLSAQQFASRDLRRVVAAALEASGLPPDCLELEITESLMMQSPERAARMLAEFQADSVRVMLDDFGTGYSSLGYLARFPLSGLKIDRSFVAALEEEPGGRDAAIVRAIVGLSRDLGLELVAEGVETLRQVDLLEALGVGVMQGYYFARPIKDWQPG
ncbi:EAL domain-containing protein [Deinococcus sp. HMF7604]|uniref:EAL domain-containing protein n=1 Tax=Deinococcus betulae TaxID=2873312 RepID=UPI001CCB2DDC|nr:EAL domain-containing protein [Deinococcus betulae]MBZ9751559.1 EAL domain-containing protein [Deinococcus betulae]